MRDRFLTGIFVGIILLVLASLVLFFVRRQQVTYGDDSTPAGALQNYLIALERRDYARAYGYVANEAGKPDQKSFEQSFLSYQGDEIANTIVELGDTSLDSSGKKALADITMVHGGQGFFGEATREHATVTLLKENGAWKISDAPYPYWLPVMMPKEEPVDVSTPLPDPTLTP